MINEDMINVKLTPTEDFEPVNMKGNIMLAIFCTSYGGLFLYKFMEIVWLRLLYTDTDSIFYIQTPSDPEIPLGILLGEVVKFVVFDPKFCGRSFGRSCGRSVEVH